MLYCKISISILHHISNLNPDINDHPDQLPRGFIVGREPDVPIPYTLVQSHHRTTSSHGTTVMHIKQKNQDITHKKLARKKLKDSLRWLTLKFRFKTIISGKALERTKSELHMTLSPRIQSLLWKVKKSLS